jgi:hypothetical protein
MPLDTHFTNQKFKQVGTRPLRPDGVDKVRAAPNAPT